MEMAVKTCLVFLVVLELKVENWAPIQEYNYIKNQSYQKMKRTKVALLFLNSSMKKKLKRIGLIFDIEK